jgi:hypothetical protein
MKYRTREESLSRGRIEKLKFLFDLMIGYAYINIFVTLLYLCINLLIELVLRYKFSLSLRRIYRYINYVAIVEIKEVE